MPLNLQKNLPAVELLKKEHIFVMDSLRASEQDIRPLRVVVLNLMPLKITTETDLVRLLSNTPLQVELDFMKIKGHTPKNTPIEHMKEFYKDFDEMQDDFYDGMIITGAPVEKLKFEQVDYWQELCRIMEWTKTNVHSTFHICWGAQAAMYYHYGINKKQLNKKLFGVYPHTVEHKKSILFRGFDDVFMAPHSRHTTVARKDIEAAPGLKILASSEQAGVYAVKNDSGSQIFVFGHSEYDSDTLKREYLRDKSAGLEINVPENYFPDDDDTKPPLVSWRSHANLLFCNWLNYFVYQTTPYDLSKIV